MESEQPRRWVILLVGVGFEGGLGILAWGLGWLLGQPPWKTLHWNIAGAGWGIPASLPMMIVFLVCLRWPLGPLARIKMVSYEVIRPWFGSCTLFDLAVISLMAGVGEELLFRGVIQEAISNRFHPLVGLAATSLLFGFLHPLTPGYVVLAGLLGAYLGCLQLITGNLLVVIIAHALYDFFGLVYLVRGPALS